MDDIFFDEKPGSIFGKNYTKELQETLSQANVFDLPPITNVSEETLILLNVLYQAGLVLQARITFYKGLVPVAIITPTLRKNSSKLMPANLRMDLTAEAQQAAVDWAHVYAGLTDVAISQQQSLDRNSNEIEWELAAFAVERFNLALDVASDIMQNGSIERIPKSWSLGFVGTFFNLADVTMAGAGINSPWGKAITSCGAFGVGLAAGAAAAPATAGISLIQMITMFSLMQSANQCIDAFKNLYNTHKPNLDKQFKMTVLIETYGHGRPGNYFEREGRDVGIYHDGALSNNAESDDWDRDKGFAEGSNGDNCRFEITEKGFSVLCEVDRWCEKPDGSGEIHEYFSGSNTGEPSKSDDGGTEPNETTVEQKPIP